MKRNDVMQAHRRLAIAFELMQNAQAQWEGLLEQQRKVFRLEYSVRLEYDALRIDVLHPNGDREVAVDLAMMSELDKERRVKHVTQCVKQAMRALADAEPV